MEVPSLKHQWHQEIERFAGLPSSVVQGGVPTRILQYREGAPFTIVNYELALRDGERIEELDPDVLILDEAQRVKNRRTKTAEAIKSLRTRFAFVLAGTPIENRLDDFYSLMQGADRRILGPLWTFNERFLDLSPQGHRVHGYRNLGRLRETLRPVFLRRDRHQALSQLPERSDNRCYVEMTKKQREYMDENVQTARMLLARAEKRPGSSIRVCAGITSGFEPWPIAGSAGACSRGKAAEASEGCIPANPDTVYEGCGFKGFGDWLGTDRVGSLELAWQPFGEAREFARPLGLGGMYDWQEWLAGRMPGKPPRPPDIPAEPDSYYRDRSWTDWGDFLGTGNVHSSKRIFRPSLEARVRPEARGLQRGVARPLPR